MSTSGQRTGPRRWWWRPRLAGSPASRHSSTSGRMSTLRSVPCSRSDQPSELFASFKWLDFCISRLMTGPWRRTWPASPAAARTPCWASWWPRARRWRGWRPPVASGPRRPCPGPGTGRWAQRDRKNSNFQAQVQVRWGSSEGQGRVRKVRVRLGLAQRTLIKDLDLSYTINLVSPPPAPQPFSLLWSHFFKLIWVWIKCETSLY